MHFDLTPEAGIFHVNIKMGIPAQGKKNIHLLLILLDS